MEQESVSDRSCSFLCLPGTLCHFLRIVGWAAVRDMLLPTLRYGCCRSCATYAAPGISSQGDLYTSPWRYTRGFDYVSCHIVPPGSQVRLLHGAVSPTSGTSSISDVYPPQSFSSLLYNGLYASS